MTRWNLPKAKFWKPKCVYFNYIFIVVSHIILKLMYILQKVVIDFTIQLMNKEVGEKLDIWFSSSSPPEVFSIADLGCSVGPNTFSAVENIIEAVELKFETLGLTSIKPEFQVFFNDHTSNDFNMLSKSLPPNRRYCAAGVPGSFYGRIFPEASLHFVHSSFTIHWLSQVPEEVMDKSSPAWNKGRVYFSNSRDEVIKAYKDQHEKDMEAFLKRGQKRLFVADWWFLSFLASLMEFILLNLGEIGVFIL